MGTRHHWGQRLLCLLLTLTTLFSLTALSFSGASAKSSPAYSVMFLAPVRDRRGNFGYQRYLKQENRSAVQIPLTQDYSAAGAFGKNGLAPVRSTTHGRWGFIDRNGKYVIQPQFLNAYAFESNGLAVVQDAATEKWGYINANGKWVIAPKYKAAYSFSDDRALVLDTWDYYFINAKGQKVLDLDKFINYDTPSFCGGYFCVRNDKGAGFFDVNGKIIVNPDENSPYTFIDVFRYSGVRLVALAKDRYGRYGYIDATGKWFIQPSRDLEGAGRFASNGLAPCQSGPTYGYIDTQYDSRSTSARFRIKPQFKNAREFTASGAAAVQSTKGTWGFINAKGQEVVPFSYSWVGDFDMVNY